MSLLMCVWSVSFYKPRVTFIRQVKLPLGLEFPFFKIPFLFSEGSSAKQVMCGLLRPSDLVPYIYIEIYFSLFLRRTEGTTLIEGVLRFKSWVSSGHELLYEDKGHTHVISFTDLGMGFPSKRNSTLMVFVFLLEKI